jgi:hypothetical protein
MTPSGIEPPTRRFVTYCLKHYATARPKYVILQRENSVCHVIYHQHTISLQKVLKISPLVLQTDTEQIITIECFLILENLTKV